MRGIAAVQLLVCSLLLCGVFNGGSCCEHGWLQFGENCYRIFTDPLTKFMARLRCIMEGSDLASISNESILHYLTVQLEKVHGDRFWVGLQHDYESNNLEWSDGTSAMEEPWVKHTVSDMSSSVMPNCFGYNGALVVKIQCFERLGYICGRKKANFTSREACNWRVDPDHSFRGEATGNCLFRVPVGTTRDNAEGLCAEHEGHFVDLDDIMMDGMTAFYDHKVLANDGSRYWTGITWNGTNLIWKNSLPKDLSNLFINGTGSCITVQFNFTDVLETHLYQTECDDKANVVCSKPEGAGEDSTTTEVPMNDSAMLSCPHGYNWKSDVSTGFCYWETSFETDRLPWDEAEKYCASFGGHLSSFRSTEEEKIGLSFQYGSLAHPYWIGLKLDPETETYKWSDGTPLNYTNWAEGHPDHKDKRLRCVAMEAKEKHWVSSFCGIHSWFICRAPKQVNPPDPVLPTPVPLQSCESLAEVGRTKSYYYDGSCYFTITENYNWHRAKQFCENEGATLVSIHSDGEVAFLLKFLYESVMESNRVWIGMNALGHDGSFQWTDWTPVDFTYFSKDEPNNFQNQERCCNMHTASGLWNDENCNAQMGFVCKRRNDTTVTMMTPSTPDPTIGNCKIGWIAHHDRCYYLGGRTEKDRVNWTEALDICVAKGGYLTSIRNAKEQNFLAYLLQSLGVDAWIGLHDTIQSDRYYWVDNSDVEYVNWAPKEPSYFSLKEDCVKMEYSNMDSGVWKDDECYRKLGYICYSRKDPNLPKPPYERGTNCLHPEGWLKLGTMCFKMYEGNTLTWQEAETSCRRDSAHLVSVTDKGVKAVLSYLATEVNRSFWIGLKYEESTQTLNWLNGWPVVLTNWEKNEPSFMKNDVCMASTSEGYWKKVDCEEEMPYVCQITTGKPTKLEHYTGECPKGKHWRSGSGSYCYIHEKSFRNDYYSAHMACLRHGSHLISIHSQKELNSLEELIKSDVRSVYIGLLRNKKGGFSWSDDTPVDFVNWEEGEPENSEDQCVEMMVDTMKWRITDCVVKRNFVCQHAKANLVLEDYLKGGKSFDEESSGFPVTGIVVIFIIVLIVLLVLTAAIYYHKRSSSRSFGHPVRQQSVSFENALYNVNSASMEFQDEQKSSL